MLQYKKRGFPNLIILVELVMCFPLSNSVVERTFSFLTIFLNDSQLSMPHGTMEDCLLIAGNNSNWSMLEKEEILNEIAEEQLQKKQKTYIVDATKESVFPSHIVVMNVLIWKFTPNRVLFFTDLCWVIL